jgi:hypothetical protein
MRKLLLIASVLASASLSFSANAQDISYTYAEVGYSQFNNDSDLSDDLKLKGGYIRGSYDIAQQFNVFASYSDASDDMNVAAYGYNVKVDFKQKQSELGAGYHWAFADRTDLTADLAYLRIDTRATASLNGYRSRESYKGNAVRGTVGVRGQPSAMTEAWAKAGYFSSSDFDDSYVANVGGLIKFNRNWSIVGEVEVMRHSNRFNVGLRASF